MRAIAASIAALACASGLLAAGCTRHVDRCTAPFPAYHAGSEPPWEVDDPSSVCVESPERSARWFVDRTDESAPRELVHERADGTSFRRPLEGFEFLLGERLDGGVIVVQWVNANGPFLGVRVSIFDARGTLTHTFDEPDDGTQWALGGLAVGYDDSFTIVRLLHGGDAATVSRYSPSGERRWRHVKHGHVSAPAVDRAGNLYFRVATEDPPGGVVFAVDPDGVARWSVTLDFNEGRRRR